MKRLALIVPLLLFAAFVALALIRLGRPAHETIASKMVGKEIPDFELKGLDALHPGLSSDDLRQGTVTLVNVFASWCLPCRVESPQLQTLAEKGVVIHAVAVRDSPAHVQAFLQRYGDPYRRIGLDPDTRFQIGLGSAGVPETFLVDGAGVVRRQYIGVIRPEQMPAVLADIDKARQ